MSKDPQNTVTLHNVAMEAIMGPPFSDNLQESFYIAAREAKHVPVPKHLLRGKVGKWITANENFKDGMWSHQAVALDHLREGKNVVVTTSTGSGKSDIYKAHSLYTFDAFPSSKAIGFFPAKALQTDQLDKLVQDFAAAGYKPHEIGIISGDEKDHKKRLEILSKSRLVLMTPDVLHAWMLNNLDEPEIRKYLKNLDLCFIDETHIYSEILGSHAPYLFRRLQFSVDTLKRGAPNSRPLQFIAASASLKD